MFKTYYRLTKPGIIYGNLLTAIAGFLLAAHTDIDIWLLVAVVAGTALVIGSGCVFNNVIDRDIDKVMKRTKKRALVSGEVSVKSAVIYATILGVLGFTVLIAYVNLLTAFIGLIGFIDYVVLYTFSKRHTPLATQIGSISGATSIAAGYTAVTNSFDGAALILFLIMVFFQMPHFYAIAIYRIEDYRAARIPVLSIKSGIAATKLRIVLYIIAFTITTTLLTVFGYTGYIYLVVMLLLGLGWLRLALQGYKAKDDTKWARQIFFYSLIVILTLSVAISLGGLLP